MKILFAALFYALSIAAMANPPATDAAEGRPADGAALLALIESSLADHLGADQFSIEQSDQWIIEIDGQMVAAADVLALDVSRLSGLDITTHEDGSEGGVVQIHTQPQ